MRIIVSALCFLLTTQASAATWKCSNPDLEIRCLDGSCAVAESFTPLAITLAANQQLSVCAYSGCWQGPSEVQQAGNYTVVVGSELEWLGHTGPAADFIVVLDSLDQTGFIKGAGFSMPLNCHHDADQDKALGGK